MGCDIHETVEVKENGVWVAKGNINIGRCYDLFAILAGVRNGYGFAGCETGSGVYPISEQKGVPDDASGEYKEEVSEWSGDGHSHSWVTLKELQEYDWDRITLKSGIVGEPEFGRWLKDGAPHFYSGGVSGPNVVHITPAEMNALLEGRGERVDEKTYHTRVNWKETYREAAGGFVENVIPELEKMGNPDDVRLVFFFDN